MKTWSDIYDAAVARGQDRASAAYLADNYEARNMNKKTTLTDKQAALLAELFSRHYDDDMAFTLSDIIEFGFKDSRIFFALVRKNAISLHPELFLEGQQYKLNLELAPALYQVWYDVRGYKLGGSNALLN